MASRQHDDVCRKRRSGQTNLQAGSEWTVANDSAVSILCRTAGWHTRKWKASFGGAGNLAVSHAADVAAVAGGVVCAKALRA